ncbi:chemotaxis protein CheB [Dyella sp.]|uniref:chemotaxis protein CheB n=1 Tax=Dyella sp. TaxID=1869338 RepID=UPI002ED6B5B3
MEKPRAIAIGCSAGGLSALERLLHDVDPAISATVLVCCHTGSSDVGLLCELISRHTRLPVVEAVEREHARRGVVHVAPSGYHLLVEHDERFSLSVDPKVNFSRPSIDVLLSSAADAYRAALIGLVMTGANKDGARGLADIRRLGGMAIVQDPSDAEVPVMPQAALDIAGADHCLPLPAIAPLLNCLCL